MDKIYKVGLVGCGRSAWELHGDIVRRHPRFEMAAAYDIRKEAAERFSGEFGGMSHDSMEDFLASEIDLAVILTLSNTHAEIACDCLNEGMNVLVTKPWALNVAEADSILAAARTAGRKAYAFLPQQWAGDLLELRRLVEEGTVGRVFQIRRSGFTFGKRNDWQTHKSCGGGYLNNWGPHLIGQVLSLADEPIVQVYGEKKQIINPGDAEDMFLGILTTASGILISVEYTIMTDVLPGWVVQGDGGTIFVRGGRFDIDRVTQPATIDAEQYRNEVAVDRETVTLQEPVYGDRCVIYSDLADALDGKSEFRVTSDFARHVTEVIDAIHLSADTKRLVTLPL